MDNLPRVSVNTDMSDQRCFGCGENNPIGLKLTFTWDGEIARTEFTPDKFHQGWPRIVHGGILSCLLDEVMSSAIRYEGMNCLTTEMAVKFKRPAKVEEPLVATASITGNNKRLVKTKGQVTLPDGTLIAEGTATWYILEGGVNENEEAQAMPEGKLEAVIWDMDGVIADTGNFHFKAWQEVFRKKGVNFTEDDFRHHFGQRNDTIIRDACGGRIAPDELDVIADEKEASYRQKMAQNIKPLPGALELMRLLADNGVKMAIASSAPPENIQLITHSLGIEDYFQAIVWGREVTEGKPSPQAFLLAASKLGIEPRNCLVLEDAVAGVTAAKSAGMKCLAVTNTHPKASLKEADLVVDKLEGIGMSALETLFRPAG
ncbi:beta-phosphoglucomutase family hydrolase [Chloroflexota bacterium]